MNKLKATLQEAIEKWINDNCETPEWQRLNALVGNDIEKLMTDAAFAVLMAAVDTNKYIKSNYEVT